VELVIVVASLLAEARFRSLRSVSHFTIAAPIIDDRKSNELSALFEIEVASLLLSSKVTNNVAAYADSMTIRTMPMFRLTLVCLS